MTASKSTKKAVLNRFEADWADIKPLAQPMLSESPVEPGAIPEPTPLAPAIYEIVHPLLPPVMRVHQLARYWFCDEQTRGMVMEGWKAERPFSQAIIGGTEIHDWLELRPLTKAEKILDEKLEAWKVANEFAWYEKPTRELHRPIEYYGQTVKIVAHPDNLRVISDNRQLYVQVEEYKSVERLEKLPDGTHGYPFFKRSQAEFQAQLYRWVLGWVCPQIGEQAYNDLILSILRRPGGYPLKEYHFSYMGDAAIESQIRFIYDGWSLRRDPIIPQRFKCTNLCDPAYVARCRIAKSNWTFGTKM